MPRSAITGLHGKRVLEFQSAQLFSRLAAPFYIPTSMHERGKWKLLDRNWYPHLDRSSDPMTQSDILEKHYNLPTVLGLPNLFLQHREKSVL